MQGVRTADPTSVRTSWCGRKGLQGVRRQLDVMAVNPPGFAGSSIAIAAHRAGLPGGVDLEHADAVAARQVVDELLSAKTTFCLFSPTNSGPMGSILESAIGRGLTRVVLTAADSAELAVDLGIGAAVAALASRSVEAFVQVVSLEEAQAAQRAGAAGLVVKGCEAGGRVGEETTFILLQRIIPHVQVPVWARGGVGLHSAAACLAAGAAGVVLDWQLALCIESVLPEDVKKRIARMDGSETAILGQELGVRYRAYQRPGETAFTSLREREDKLALENSRSADLAGRWRQAVEERISGRGDGGRLLLMGQDAVFAKSLADRFRTVGEVCRAVQRSATAHCGAAARQEALRPDGSLAQSHGTRYPIVQGPMTRVSDTAEFALSVAQGGGLPFLALALLRGPQVAVLLEETKRKLGDRPWGIGILGFVPRELRDEQLAEVRKHPPPYAIIAGGRPDQAAELERGGIHTYLHIPSPALLKMFLEGGVRRVIFEGRECGGHVGPRTSFVLWEQMIEVILEHLRSAKGSSEKSHQPEDYHVLFAGGIHDATSASMVAAMAAPLSERGVRIGVLLGTSYLFTKEAVGAGAIVEGFQREALECRQTILLESGVGHATRCADTPFGRVFAEEKRRLIGEGRSKDEIREALETLNLGRLRIASKGVVRADGSAGDGGSSKFRSLDGQDQRHEGMYMIGQVAALRDRVCTIEELHEDVSRKGAERLASFAQVNAETTRAEATKPCDVAIVGMSCMFPKARDVDAFWSNILNKVDAIQEIPADRWDWKLYFDSDRSAPDKIYSKWGGFLDDVLFDPTSYGMPPNTLPSVEPLQLLVLEAVREALRDAGYEERAFDRERTAVVLGAGGGVADLGLGYGFRALLPYFMANAGGDAKEAAQFIERLEGCLPEWTEDSFAGLLMNVAAGRIANRFDLGGANYAVDAACASSLAAVRLAAQELTSGAADMAIVGGADTMQSPFAYLCFSKTQALSPTGQCRTFDETADGIVISEGIAMAVLKRVADAERDGDRIYAVIKGIGSSSDGRDKGLTAPHPAGQIRALERAYAQAGYGPATVGLVEAHGTGTVAGDQSEVESLTRTFVASGASRQSCALGSVKSMIGHTKCTAGIAGLLKAALALYYRVLPPTNGVTKPNPKANFSASPFYISSETRPWLAPSDGEPRRAGVSAFGFGGTNFHATLEEHPGSDGVLAAKSGLAAWPAELLVWHAETAQTIVLSIDKILAGLDGGAAPALHDLAAAVWREFAGVEGLFRLAVVATSPEDLKEKLVKARAAVGAANELRDPSGIYYSTRGGEGKVAFLFPGQGSQCVNMLRDLAVAFPTVRAVFEEADRGLGDVLGRRLSGFIFPCPSFTPEEGAAHDAALTETRVAQPAIGAADLAVFQLLTELGLRPDFVGGHSYGEYAALCAAGALGLSDLLRISEARGRLICDAAKVSPGTMAAIDADESAVAKVLDGLKGVWIANLNAPSQTVISGTQAGVEDALQRLSVGGLKGRRIRVSCAFHSPLVAAARGPFRAVLDEVGFARPMVPVFSNTTARAHDGDVTTLRGMLAEHLVRPVRFVDEVLAMYEAGARVFVEVGPGRVLTGLVERTLAGRSFKAVHVDQAGRNGVTQLLHALAQLSVVGVKMDLRPLFERRCEATANVSQLMEQAKPALPSPTTWKVNGARAVPLKGPEPRPRAAAPARVSPPSLTPPTPIAERPIAGSLATASNLPSTVSSGDVGAVMSGYQGLMAKFLETQKNVMLGFLQGNSTGATPLPSPERTEPLPVQSAPPVPIAPASEAERVQAPPASQAPVSQDDPGTEWTREKITSRLVSIVGERTGYPAEMLGLDLDMEADLGIDSIKRVEILGTLQQESMVGGKSLDKDMEALAKLKTLRSIVDWLVEAGARGDAAVVPAKDASATAERAVERTPVSAGVPRMLLEVVECPVSSKTTTRLSDGVVLIVDGGDSPLAAAVVERLESRGARTALISGGASGKGKHVGVDLTDRASVEACVDRIRASAGFLAAMIYLSRACGSRRDAGDAPGTCREGAYAESRALLNLAQTVGPQLRSVGGGRLLAVTAMGGGFDDGSPADGAVCGFVKSLGREWSEVACKIVDVDSRVGASELAEAVATEFETSDGQAEVGYRGGRRVTLRPVAATLDPQAAESGLDEGSVVLLTGGARGITAEVAIELARRFRSTLLLTGRSPLPPAKESQRTAGAIVLRELKEILRLDLERGGAKVTPAAVEQAYGRLQREREIRVNLSAMREAGATVEYHAVDVVDAAAFGALIDDIYAKHRRLDAVVHGAGVTEDKFIADKTRESMMRVLRPKIEGALTLAAKLRPESLKFLFFFSSVSARYGNRGQCDYAAANEFLNKLAHTLNARWPSRVASLNWGPWESSGGMVSPELAQQFAAAGITLISRPAGRRAFVDELLHGRKEDVEVIFGGPLQVQPTPTAPEEPDLALALLNGRSRVTRPSDRAIEVVRELDPSFDVYLVDHQLDGKPVMPMAMGLELVSEVASLLAPADMRLCAIRDLKVLHGIRFDEGPRTIHVTGLLNRVRSDVATVDLRVRTEGDRSPACYTATAEFRAKAAAASPIEPLALVHGRPFPMSVEEAYEKWLFHGPLFAGIVELEGIGDNGIIARIAPSLPQRCLAESPAGTRWLVDPVALDSGLQLVILWARTYLDSTPLPSRFTCYHRLGDLSAGQMRCEARIYNVAPGRSTMHVDIMFYDAAGQCVGWLEDIEVACSKALNRLTHSGASSAGAKS